VNRLDPIIWALLLLLVALLLATIGDVARVLWAARKPEPPPYDWARDERLLDEWARDAEGELYVVGPEDLIQWRYQ
jgi:hypothetical protein